MDGEMFEYAMVWCLYNVKDINRIDRIYRRATRFVPSLTDKPYKMRLGVLNLSPLKEGSERNYLIAIIRSVVEVDKTDREDLLLWNGKISRGCSNEYKQDHIHEGHYVM